MALVHHFLLSILVVLCARAVLAAPIKLPDSAASSLESLARWPKYDLELLGHPEDPTVDSSPKSRPIPAPEHEHERNSTVTGDNTSKPVIKSPENIKSIFCRGTGCLIGVVIVTIVLSVLTILCLATTFWCCDRKRRSSGDSPECVDLLSNEDGEPSGSDPPLLGQKA